MKIRVNLAVRPTVHERFALAWSLPTALAALVVMVWLAHSALADLRDYRALEAQLVEAQRREGELSRRDVELRRGLDRPEFRATLREAQFVNSLIAKKQLSLSALAVRVADLLPPDARLSALALARSDNDSAVRFEVTGKSAEALETFLGNLANSPDFEDPVITSEGFEQQGSTAGEVTVTCTARYVGARDGGKPATQK
jgi:hypothetical protein